MFSLLSCDPPFGGATFHTNHVRVTCILVSFLYNFDLRILIRWTQLANLPTSLSFSVIFHATGKSFLTLPSLVIFKLTWKALCCSLNKN